MTAMRCGSILVVYNQFPKRSETFVCGRVNSLAPSHSERADLDLLKVLLRDALKELE